MKKTGKSSRFLSVIISAALAVSSVAALPLSAAESSKTYKISTADELIEFSKLCSLDSWSKGKEFVLTSDIILTGKEFSSIPIFSGTFDGQGHSIKGVSVTGVTGRGLFSIIGENAAVKNLNVVGIVRPSGSESSIGGIAGTNKGVVYNCKFSGKVAATNTVGGIVGENTSTGSVLKCTAAGTVDGEKFTGGVVGNNSGNIVQSINAASVNTTNEEKKHSLEDIDLSTLTDVDSYTKKSSSSDETASATDTGGIAGYSTGTIFSCENSGSIGYPHVGYNIGGIAGRSSGIIMNSKNYGQLNGRKDIGGIAGQMEPYLVVNINPDNMAKLKDELENLSNLIDTAINETNDDALGINATVESASGYLQSATDSADNIQQKLTDYGDHLTSEFDRTSAVISDAIERLDKITGLIPDASNSLSTGSDRLSEAFDGLSGTQKYSDDSIDKLKKLSDEIKDASQKANDASKKIGDGLKTVGDSLHSSATDNSTNLTMGFEIVKSGIDELSTATKGIADAIKAISDILSGGIGEIPPDISSELSDLADSIAKISDAMGTISWGVEQILDSLNIDSDTIHKGFISASDGFKALGDAIGNTDESTENIQKILDNTADTEKDVNSSFGLFSDAFTSFTNTTDILTDISSQTSEIFDFLNNVETIEIGSPDDSIKDDTENLFSSLTSFIDAMNTLNVQASNAGVTLSDNLVKINDQTYVVSDIITDMLDIDDEEDYIKDTSDVDTDKIKNGKVYKCTNYGTVSGDLNIGGIAGQIAIEYDFDPEDDISGKTDSPLDQKLETKAAAIKNTNYGEIVAKKNCAGGIAGQMSLGVVKNCSAFGKITSESGDYVGGISGKSSAKIISCYAKALLSGRNYIGGIAGSADTVLDCYSLVDITDSQSYFGAISGTTDGEFEGNYFVSDKLCGLNGASYKGAAEPIPYQQLISIPNIPEEFRTFTLKFIADDNVVDKIEFSYGDTIDESELPAIPAKDDCYAKWNYDSLEDLHIDKEIEAEYFTVIKNVHSDDCRDGGKPIWLAEGIFTEDDTLPVQQNEYVNQTPPVIFLMDKTELCESWTLTVPNDNSETHNLRYLVNAESKRDPEIYVKNSSGEWEKAETRHIGSYLYFEASGNSPEILAVYKTLNIFLIAVTAAGVVIIILVIIFSARAVRKKKKAKAAKK